MFSFLTGRSLPFIITSKSPVHSVSGWELHTGTKREDGSAVSVFIGHSTTSGHGNCLKRFKTIRHPSLIRYIDSVQEEDGKIYLVCEPVQPVSGLSGVPGGEAILYGLYQIATALGFLNQSGFIHANVQLSSVYQTQSGEWKLFGFEYLTTPADYHGSVGVSEWRSPEANRGGLVNYQQLPVAMVDSWMFASFTKQLFQRFNDPSGGKMAAVLGSMLSSQQPAEKRPSIADLLQLGLRPGGYFDTPLIRTAIFLDNITVKDSAEKVQFFKNLSSSLDSFPESFAKSKVMPVLMNAIEFGSAGPRIFPMILQIANQHLSSQEFGDTIVPLAQRLSNLPDRSIRNVVLENLESILAKCDAKAGNDKLFPQVLSGLTDPMPLVRESSIKSVLLFAPNLPEKTVNQELVKAVARLQVDEEPGIRANATICLGKLSKYLNSETKKRTLLPTLLNALRDPFPPSRSASLMAIIATVDAYDAEDLARNVGPVILNCTLDPEKSVRDYALKLMELFIRRLAANSESLAEAAEKAAIEAAKNPQQQQRNTTGSGIAGDAISSWGSWAVGAVTKKLTDSVSGYTPTAGSAASDATPPTQPPSTSTEISPKSPDMSGSIKSAPSASGSAIASSNFNHQNSTQSSASGWDGLDALAGFGTAKPLSFATSAAGGTALAKPSSSSGGAMKLSGSGTSVSLKTTQAMADQLLAELSIGSSNSSPAESERRAELERKKEERRQKIEALKQQRRNANQQ